VIEKGKDFMKRDESLSNYISNVQENIINVPIFVHDDSVFIQNFRECNPQYQFLPLMSILIIIDSVLFCIISIIS